MSEAVCCGFMWCVCLYMACCPVLIVTLASQNSFLYDPVADITAVVCRSQDKAMTIYIINNKLYIQVKTIFHVFSHLATLYLKVLLIILRGSSSCHG